MIMTIISLFPFPLSLSVVFFFFCRARGGREFRCKAFPGAISGGPLGDRMGKGPGPGAGPQLLHHSINVTLTTGWREGQG